MKKINITIFSLILLSVAFSDKAFELPNIDTPKTVNLYWKTPITMAEVPVLAKWDMLSLDMKAQVDSAEAIKRIRQIEQKKRME